MAIKKPVYNLPLPQPLTATKTSHDTEVNRVVGELVQNDLSLSARIDAGIAVGTVVGSWNAGSGAFPTTRPGGGQIQVGDTWRVSVAGTVDGVSFVVGDYLQANRIGGGATFAGNWARSAIGIVVQAAEEAAEARDETVNAAPFAMKDPPAFFAMTTLILGARYWAKTGEAWDIVAPGAGDFNHPVTGLGVSVAVQGGKVPLTAWPIDVRYGVNTSSAAMTWPSDMADSSPYIASARAKCFASQCILVLPGGVILVNQPGAFLPQSYTTRKNGYGIEGTPETVVCFAPSAGSELNALFWNNNSVMGVFITSVRFHTLTAGAVFWNSYGNGVSQNHNFRDCRFTGTWVNLFVLSVNPVDGFAGNNNSEYRFDSCASGIYSNNFNWLRGQSSDQNLNYYFNQCAMWGDICIANMTAGGHVYVTDCDVSGYEPSQEQYLFRLLGTVHSRGVCTLKVDGLRVEAKNENAKLIYCEWPQGSVEWDGLDMSSQAYETTYTEPAAIYRLVNVQGPIVSYKNSQIMGVTRFTVATNNGNFAAKAHFEDCTFMNAVNPSEAFDFERIGAHSNPGAFPSVELSGCRGRSTSTVDNRIPQWDCNVGWANGAKAQPKTRQAMFRNAAGQVPATGGQIQLLLPPNAILRQVFAYLAPGVSVSSAAMEFKLIDADGLELATFATTNMASAGMNAVVEARGVLDTDNKRLISLVPQPSVNVPTRMAVMIEYLA